MTMRNAKAVFRHRPFSLTTKILLAFAVVVGFWLGQVPGGFKHRVHNNLWNLADHSRYADYWFAMLHLSMPWAYAPSTEVAEFTAYRWDVHVLEATNG